MGAIPYSSLISLAIGPAMTMATVLFAVEMSIAPTSSPTPRRPPTLPWNTRRMKASRAAKPPCSRIRAHMAETRIVTMMVSNIPSAPSFMLPSSSMKVTVPVGSTMATPDTIPISSTRNTLSPEIPPISTNM